MDQLDLDPDSDPNPQHCHFVPVWNISLKNIISISSYRAGKEPGVPVSAVRGALSPPSRPQRGECRAGDAAGPVALRVPPAGRGAEQPRWCGGRHTTAHRSGIPVKLIELYRRNSQLCAHKYTHNLNIVQLQPVLRIRDAYLGSVFFPYRIRIK